MGKIIEAQIGLENEKDSRCDREIVGGKIMPKRVYKNPKERAKKISKALKGKPLTKEHRKNISLARKGMKFSEQHKKNLSLSHIGKFGYWKGRKRSKTDREKFRISHLGKKQSQATILKRIKKGSEHYNWQGGITPLTRKRVRGVFWRQIANEIRKRDNNTCQLCGFKGNGKKLSVHHFTAFKISKDNNYNNLITLCQSCHIKLENPTKKYYNKVNNLILLCPEHNGKVNSNRGYWEAVFQQLINEHRGVRE